MEATSIILNFFCQIIILRSCIRLYVVRSLKDRIQIMYNTKTNKIHYITLKIMKKYIEWNFNSNPTLNLGYKKKNKSNRSIISFNRVM